MLDIEPIYRPARGQWERGPQVDQARLRIDGTVYKAKEFTKIIDPATGWSYLNESGFRTKFKTPAGLLKVEWFLAANRNQRQETNSSREWRLWNTLPEDERQFFQPIHEYGDFTYEIGDPLSTQAADYVLVPYLRFRKPEAITDEMYNQYSYFCEKYQIQDKSRRQIKALVGGGFVIHDYPAGV